MAEKKSKESVDYSAGMASARCGICRHYIVGGMCRKVSGNIDPRMWCKLFERSKDE